eukprot:CAMPEP_0202708076 /NCGR_PEP_ID=MMETSP1385-20130828/20334_1 /ASSEMBLY_ACC=CAM_ASM_000861 /TAXON_ID=933848 /ORGANISM="Elphidium margaritaceum" /LENGTH=198 /DNA_ID=CAMNT_0049366963 /DNA_START=81 /DNA_END=677 /DNA_ORIENTATION=+
MLRRTVPMANRLAMQTRTTYPATAFLSRRDKTYLVGVDGSEYGYNALRAVSKMADSKDKIISMYFPVSIALVMERYATFHLSDDQIGNMERDLFEARTKMNEDIEAKCKQIVMENAPAHINAYCKIYEESFKPREELIKSCYETKADVLVVGEKGLAHGVREKLSQTVDKMRRHGGLVDFAVHHAPCDILIIKKEHEY